MINFHRYPTSITVNKVNSVIDVIDTIIYYGESVNVAVTTEGSEAITAKSMMKTLMFKATSFTIPEDLESGNHTLTITTTPDKNHNPTTKTVKIVDCRIDNNVTVVVEGVEYPIKVVDGKVVIDTNKTELVIPSTVVVDGVVYPVEFVNGTLVVDTNKTESVVSSIVVVDGVMYPVEFVNGTLVVDTNKTEPVAPVTVVVDGVEYSVEYVDGTAVVNTNKTEPDNNVTVVVDGKEYSAEIVDGKVTIKTDSAEPVSNGRLGTVIIADDFEQYSCDYYAGERGGYFTAQLKDSNGNPLVNKTVLIGYNGINFNRTTNETGWIAVQIGLQNAGLYTFGMSYLGDDNYNASFLVKGINIVKKPTSIVAKDKKFKAKAKTKKLTVTLKTIVGSSIDGNAHLKEGKLLTLKVNGKIYKAKTDANGKATFKIKNLNKKGIYIAKIAFKRDTFVYDASSKKVKLTVK